MGQPASPSSSRCKHSDGTHCLHRLVGGVISGPAKCASCMHYDGPMRGAGDMVASLFRLTGVKAVANKIVQDCGCGERRAALNAAVPFADKENKES